MPHSDSGPATEEQGEPLNSGTKSVDNAPANQIDSQLLELLDSWDPVDDEVLSGGHRQTQWVWHGRSSLGSKAVSAFPAAALFISLLLGVSTTFATQRPTSTTTSILGTGGAELLSSKVGPSARYHDVNFQQKSRPMVPIQGSTSLSLPPYAAWQANGSAGIPNGFASARQGVLHVGIHKPTAGFTGWFLTANSATPASCVFQFSAQSPPDVSSRTPGAIGELVMAVQTSDTLTTGDINYIVVAENVSSDGRRSLVAGYSLGHIENATEHILKRVNWKQGALHVSIQSNGNNKLDIWVNGKHFLHKTNLHMGIVPAFQPYLEVQAKQTAYAVSFSNYSSVCHSNTVISNLPTGSVARLGDRRSTAHNGMATFPAPATSAPISGDLTVALPGSTHIVRFPRHTYWPGDRYSFQSGT